MRKRRGNWVTLRSKKDGQVFRRRAVEVQADVGKLMRAAAWRKKAANP